jgi:pimeloyl-ACP methyl ester carboxylesterase
MKLAAGSDLQLLEHLRQVVLDGSGADEQAGADLGIGEPLNGQPGDARLLRRELPGYFRCTLAHCLSGGQQLPAGAFGETRHPHCAQQFVRGPELLAGICTAVLAAQPFAVQQTGTGVVGLDARAAEEFAAQGGDWGGAVSNVMGKQAPAELACIHVNFPGTVPPDVAKALQAGGPPPSGLSGDERRAYDQLSTLYAKRRAYSSLMGTRPQALTGIADSPAGLAAWLLDHGDSYGQPAAPVTSAVLGHTTNGHPAGALTRDDVLDKITLYWLTNTAISAARLYWENKLSLYNDADVSVPAAVSAFPGEGYQAPRSWTERAYHNLIYYNQPDKGGHFAAWEQPQLFAEEVRAGLRPLRK